MRDRKELPEHDLDWVDGRTPFGGLGGTVGGFGTDRKPCTVMKVSDSGHAVWVADDEFDRVDDNGMSEIQRYRYFTSANHDDPQQWTKYTLRQNGRWVREGDQQYSTLSRLTLGVRNRWFNYSL